MKKVNIISRREDILGQRFGRLFVIERIEKTNRHGKTSWKYRCDCGNIVIVLTASLKNGNTKSCGCLNRDLLSERNKNRIYKLGKDSSNWKGGRRISTQGYVMIRINNTYKSEHTLIAEKILNRKLKRNECVHHINGTKNDNRNCNLLICNITYHNWLHWHMAVLYQREKFIKCVKPL